MTALAPRRVTIVWAALVVATLVTWWIGTDHPSVLGSARVAPTAAIVIAFVKIHLVGQDFMELRGAHPVLRAAFATWTIVVGLATAALYAV